MKFALASLRGTSPADKDAAQRLQALAFNAISSSATAMATSLGVLALVEDAGYVVRRERLAEVLNAQVHRYVEVLRSNEIAWALWGALAFDIPLSVPANLGKVEDDVVALLALDGVHRGLWNVESSLWQSWMTAGELRGSHWLVAYEASLKEWLPTSDLSDHVASDKVFSILKAARVHFYDESLSASPRMPRAARRLPGGTISSFYA